QRDALVARVVANVDGAVLERLLADGDPDRRADEVGVRKLLAGTRVAIVEENVESGRVELRGELLGAAEDLVAARMQGDDLDVERREGCGPADRALLPVLLDRRREHATRPDTVAPHHDGMLPALFVQKLSMQRLGVPR